MIYSTAVTKRHVQGDLLAGTFERGRLVEPVSACTKHRKVKLYTRRPGEDKKLAGTTYTDRHPGHHGDWGETLGHTPRPFRYFAVVTEERKDGYHCARDKSSVRRKRELGAGSVAMSLGAQRGGGVLEYDTKLRITADRGFLYGWVKPGFRKCERGRWVTLFKQRPGADRRLATDRTGGPGRWRIEVVLGFIEAHVRPVATYAKVRPKVRDRFVCLADRAPNTGTFR